MLTRRDLMRALSLATLAVAAPQVLGACGSPEQDPVQQGDTDITLVSSDVERSDGDPDALPDAVSSIHALGAGLYGALAAKQGNLALSPYSVAVALALTVNGARGTTESEMLTVLDTADTDRLNGGLNALTQHVESLAGPQKRGDGSKAEVALDSANALFGEISTTWNDGFLDTLAREYGAGMQAVDYIGATEAARAAINGWTAERTHDRIEEIIPGGVLDTMTRLVLVNALYLKAPWEEPFEELNTAPRHFHLGDGSTVDVPTMLAVLKLAQAGSGEGWQAVRLVYAGNGLAMTVVLPDEGRLEDVEASIGAGDLPAILASVQPESVSLTLPKWTFRTASGLNQPLIDLGMPTAFRDGADFSGMTTDEALYIGAVLHQVFIAVDEKGTEAAAATAVVMEETTGMMPGLEMVVDRPFLFVIHDVEHGTPLFVGRVADPREA